MSHTLLPYFGERDRKHPLFRGLDPNKKPGHSAVYTEYYTKRPHPKKDKEGKLGRLVYSKSRGDGDVAIRVSAAIEEKRKRMEKKDEMYLKRMKELKNGTSGMAKATRPKRATAKK